MADAECRYLNGRKNGSDGPNAKQFIDSVNAVGLQSCSSLSALTEPQQFVNCQLTHHTMLTVIQVACHIIPWPTIFQDLKSQ
jgi:hypothetical protein